MTSIYDFFFSKKGRLGRKGFILGACFHIFILIQLYVLSSGWESGLAKMVFFCVFGVPIYLSYSALICRRYHDFNEDESSERSLRHSLPIIGEFLAIDQLVFRLGCKGENMYGGKPRV